MFGRPGLLSHFSDESTGSDKKGDHLQKNVTSVRVRAKAPRPAAQAFKKILSIIACVHDMCCEHKYRCVSQCIVEVKRLSGVVCFPPRVPGSGETSRQAPLYR